MFIELHGTRTTTPTGADGAITYLEIIAWSNLTQLEVGPDDVRAIKLLDAAYLSSRAK